LEAVSGNDRPSLLRALDSAARRRLLASCPDSTQRYRFSHALVRDCLYERLTLLERARVHARIGAALDELYRNDIGRHLPEIAAHFARGAAAGNARAALTYCVSAARDALARHAPEESLRHWSRALDLWHLGPERDDSVRCEILLGIGESHQRAGDPQTAR